MECCVSYYRSDIGKLSQSLFSAILFSLTCRGIWDWLHYIHCPPHLGFTNLEYGSFIFNQYDWYLSAHSSMNHRLRLVDERLLSCGWNDSRPKLNRKRLSLRVSLKFGKRSRNLNSLHACIIQLFILALGGAAILGVTAVVSQNRAESNQRKVLKNIRKMSLS